MLKIYLASVLIFMIINISASTIFRNAYIKNGWIIELHNSWPKRIYNAFLLSAVPILRVFITVMLICMAVIKREDLEKIVEEKENGD